MVWVLASQRFVTKAWAIYAYFEHLESADRSSIVLGKNISALSISFRLIKIWPISKMARARWRE